MQQGKKYYLTKKGLEKVKKELRELKDLRLSKIRGDAPRSFRFGTVDPEYLIFQEEIGLIEKKIKEIEDVLENYEIIQAPPKKERKRVYLGARVLVEMDGLIEEFEIVGTIESDPAQKRISNESPLGKALLGKSIGEEIEVVTPMVRNVCKIIKIEYEGN